MAKSMARIKDGSVINIEWHSDSATDTSTLISVNDRPVAIGDTYESGKFYREGVEILTPLEGALKTIAIYEKALRTMGVEV